MYQSTLGLVGCNVRYLRWLCLRYVTQQLAFRLFTAMLIFLDLALILADLVIDCPADPASAVIANVDLVRAVCGKKAQEARYMK